MSEAGVEHRQNTTHLLCFQKFIIAVSLAKEYDVLKYSSKKLIFYLIFYNQNAYLNLLSKTPKLILSPDCKDTEAPLRFDPLTKVPYLDVSLTVNIGTERD